MSEQAVQMINLNQLAPSELNMRTVHDSKDDKTLKASLKHFGVLQNLIVHKQGKKFGVAGGGRRLRLLQELAKEKEIDTKVPVPCRLVEKDQALSMSIAENDHVDPHPADEFVAYRKLAESGISMKDIAAQFGVLTKYVKQRMTLGAVHPKILEDFKKGKIRFNEVMAYTVEPDTELQLKVFRTNPGFWEIKEKLNGSEYNAQHKLAKFVTVKAYKAAGGATVTDLFEDEVLIKDGKLLERLAMEKLQAIADKLKSEAWSWVEVCLDAKTWEYSRLNAQNKAYSDKQKAESGMIVTIAYSGKKEVHRGMVRPGDKKKASATGKSKSTYSQALTADIGEARQMAFRGELAKHPDLVKCLLQFGICLSVFEKELYHYNRTFVRISPANHCESSLGVGVKLDLSWTDHESELDKFNAFRELKPSMRDKITMYAMIENVETTIKGSDDFVDAIMDEIDVPFREHYTPTKDNFFSRISKPMLLAIIKKTDPGSQSYIMEKDKKSVIVEYLHDLFNDDKEKSAAVSEWLPVHFK